jgi:uncharacterized membrane protein YadS
LLAPVLLLVGWQAARGGHKVGKRVQVLHVFPMFVIGFLAMALLRTLGLLPQMTVRLTAKPVLGGGVHEVDVVRVCETVSKYLIVAAMAAVGLETRFSALRKTGLRPLLLGMSAAVVIAGVILGGLIVMRA